MIEVIKLHLLPSVSFYFSYESCFKYHNIIIFYAAYQCLPNIFSVTYTQTDFIISQMQLYIFWLVQCRKWNEVISATAHIRAFPIYCRILEALRVDRRYSTPHFASTPERSNENIKYFNFSISSSVGKEYKKYLPVVENTKPPLVSELMLTISTLLVRHELCARAHDDVIYVVLTDNYDNVGVVQQAAKLWVLYTFL